jgi:hypothetical protein
LVAVVSGIAAFSGNVLSIRDNFWKLFGTESNAILSFSLQQPADIHRVIVLITNTGAKPATMLGASLTLNNPDSIWNIPLDFRPEDATISGDSAQVVKFIVPDDIGGRVQIVTGRTPESSPRCFVSVTVADQRGGKKQYPEISCGDLAYLMVGLQSKIHEWKKQH